MNASSHRSLLRASERFFGHVAAIVAGFVLMIVGISLGVTIVLLPAGIPVGLAGLFLFLWGLMVFLPKDQPHGARNGTPE
jgi:hypothetical protein